MYMKDSTNYPNSQTAAHVLRLPRHQRAKVKTLISFQSLLPVYLLFIGLAVICQSYSITNRTDGNKIANIWSICGPVFKTFA